MKFFKELFEILASIPFFGIIGTVFSGEYGWKPPVAFILQVILQIVCAVMLGLGVGGTILVAALLLGMHLFMGLLIGMMPLSGMGPKPMYSGAADYLCKATAMSLLYTGIGGAVIIGLSMLAATGHFLPVFALSTLGGTALHLFGVALPIYQLEKSHEKNQEKDQDNA